MKRNLLILILLSTCRTHASSELEAQKKNAFLVLNAFECYLVAPNTKESKHFLKTGLGAAKELIEFIKANNQLYVETIKPHLPLIWDIKPDAPDSEFIIGRVCSYSINKVNKSSSANDNAWAMKKAHIYQEKNCQLLAR